MKLFPLVWATLWRSRTRTVLTLLSLVVAFLLLGLIQAADSLFVGGSLNLSASPTLITQARVSFTSPLPMRLLPQIEAVPGVEGVSHSQFFGGIYQDPKNFFPQFAVNPDRWIPTFPECRLSPEDEARWRGSRTGVIAGRQLVDRFGWKIGDPIPLLSQIWPQKDGSRSWNFELAGIFDHAIEDSCARQGNMYLRFDYFDEARQFGQGSAGLYVVRINNPDDAERIGQAIDAMFENSPDETKTQTEKDFSLNFVRQLGNVKLILYSILGAVFFAILLLTYNTMSQAVQDRIPELAVLKTLGFTDSQVLRLILAESLLLCVLGGLAGMLLSLEAMQIMAKISQSAFPPLKADLNVWLFGLASMLILGVLIGLLPAYRAWRLSIVDALAGR